MCPGKKSFINISSVRIWPSVIEGDIERYLRFRRCAVMSGEVWMAGPLCDPFNRSICGRGKKHREGCKTCCENFWVTKNLADPMPILLAELVLSGCSGPGVVVQCIRSQRDYVVNMSVIEHTWKM